MLDSQALPIAPLSTKYRIDRATLSYKKNIYKSKTVVIFYFCYNTKDLLNPKKETNIEICPLVQSRIIDDSYVAPTTISDRNLFPRAGGSDPVGSSQTLRSLPLYGDV